MRAVPPDPARPMRILLIAYRFPPQAGGGVQRPSKLVKYLLRSGQQVAVVTGPETWTSLDRSLLDDLSPELVRLSVSDPSPFRPLQEFRRGIRFRPAARFVQGILWSMNAVAAPDLTNAWLVAAFGRTVELVGNFRPDVILVTGPPWSPVLLARLVSMTTGVPFVVDYRDPWTENYLDLDVPAIPRFVNRYLERWILGRAAGVIAAHRAILRRLAPLLAADTPRIWIPNGYDPDDFLVPVADQARAPEARDCFILGYTGSFFDRRSPGVLFGVMEDLLQSGRIDPGRFRVRIAGELGPAQRLLHSLPHLAAACRAEGYLSHPESIDVLRTSDLNLVYESDGERNVTTPAKLYETLAAGRPILLVCPPGVTARLGRWIGGCSVVDPEDEAATKSALLDAYDSWCRREPVETPPLERCRFYERSRLALRVLGFLRRIRNEGETR